MSKTNGTPAAYATALGTSFISHITDSERFPILVIGADRWSRYELAREVGVTNTVAAGFLTKIAKDLGARSAKHLYATTTPYTFSDPRYRVGNTTLYVLFAVFRSEGLSVENWYRKGSTEAQTLVTFHSFKKREQDAEARTWRGVRN